MVQKLKPLRPTLKERKRYVVYRVEGASAVEVTPVIQQACLTFMGVLTASKAGIMFLQNQSNGPYGIIRVAHTYVDELKASLLHITNIDGKPVAIDAIGVSGILKKAKEKFIDKAYRVQEKKVLRKKAKQNNPK